ncbi:MAG: ABC transporter permease [Clostridiales Family XIII bacterium]|jgi:ribose transport system permease protein|nr:ABC transporter permease [Clostridiales Family XIII bacterium]
MKTKNGPDLKMLAKNREVVVILILLAGTCLVSAFTPYFLTSANLLSIFMGVSVEGLIAVGMALVLINGGMDLAVGSTMAFTGVAVGLLLKNGVPVLSAILIAMLLSAGIGLMNGLLIAKLGLNPFIATLGIMSAIRGIMLILSKGMAVLDMPPAFTVIGQGGFGNIQYPIFITISIVIISDIALRNSRFFRQSYYVGSNEKAAKLNGINVVKVKIFNYCICGLCAGIAGIIVTARFGSASVTLGSNTALSVITACIIGGASLNGGQGTILGAFLGALFMQVLSTSLNLLGVNIYWQNLITGIILILAILIDSLNEMRVSKQKML